MTYDPNLNRRPDPEHPVATRSGSSWAPWALVGAVVIVGLVIWSMTSGPAVDPATTSSTMPPAATENAPATEPLTPEAPATNDVAPTTPAPAPAEPQQ